MAPPTKRQHSGSSSSAAPVNTTTDNPQGVDVQKLSLDGMEAENNHDDDQGAATQDTSAIKNHSTGGSEMSSERGSLAKTTVTDNDQPSDQRNSRKTKSEAKKRDTNQVKTNPQQQPHRNLADELKLFQNSNLLNQQDPIEQLQRQLNELIESDAPNGSSHVVQRQSKGKQVAGTRIDSSNQHSIDQNTNDHGNVFSNKNGGGHSNNNNSCLSYATQQQQLSSMQSESSQENQQPTRTANQGDNNNFNINKIQPENAADFSSTVKKGVLWQQQNYDKFHQRLFSRWKKRYFILTTDYLVCFKRSSSKVGHSEMGKFLYKFSLCDIVKSEWTKPKKSDKGAIVLYIKGQFNLFLWCKNNLDEWMFLIDESIKRLKVRRSNTQMACSLGNQIQNGLNSTQNGFYENNNNFERIENGQSDHDRHNLQHCEPVVTRRKLSDTTAESRTSKTFATSQTVDSNLTGKDGTKAVESSMMINERPTAVEVMQSNGHHPNHRASSSERTALPKMNDDGHHGQQKSHDNSRDASIERQNQLTDPMQTPNSNSRKRGSFNDGSGGSRRTSKAPTTLDQTICGSDENGKKSVLVNSRTTSSGNSTDRSGHASTSSDFKKPNELETGRSISNKPQTENSLNNISNDSNKKRPNLIRRDDSWQSLVSLTRVGKSPMQVAQRSLYAQHIMPSDATEAMIGNNASACRTPRVASSIGHHGSINIESTVTPIRSGPLWRQQSVQVGSTRVFRPLPSLGQDLHGQTPPVSNAINSPLHANHRSTSYQHKLLHLQMLHNNAQSDYVRHGHKGDPNNNDYPIYAPESVNTNHYGYYSMRSNLKSAASEFSFIRPSSSNMQPTQMVQQQHNQPQSTLPHQSSLGSNRTTMANNNQAFHHLNRPQRSSLILTNNEVALRRQQQQQQQNLMPQSDFNNNHIGQCLVNSKTVDQLVVGNSGGQHNEPHDKKITLAELIAPNRELPLKPNRRRDLIATTSSVSGATKNNSSIGSSIVCFFKRAFSRRSKKRPSNKLAESCSSSLGAFDDIHSNVHILPSAFSTGGKSIDERQHHQDKLQVNGNQRMIDMIEAFNDTMNNAQQPATNVTSQTNQNLVSRVVSANNNERNVFATPNLVVAKASPAASNQLRQARQQHQLGSPLHKSNSISTTMGWTSLSETNYIDNHNLISQHNIQQTTIHDNEQQHPASMDPSMMTPRLIRGMSVNLTPSFKQREPQLIDQFAHNITPHHQQLFVSPRASQRGDQLPRPSSIYGQPSMISSPIATNDRSNDHQFGLHRSSLHGGQAYGLYRENRISSNQNFIPHELRRHKAPFLDTTKEVAEEVSSPTVETRTFDPKELRLNGQSEMMSPMISNGNGRLQRQAIVNPILQSPRTDAIYDNHPTLLNGDAVADASGYSHYDNQHLMMEQRQQHRAQRESRQQSMATGDDDQSINRRISMESIRNSPSMRHSQSSHLQPRNTSMIMSVVTPSRSSRSSSIDPTNERSTVVDMMLANSKPSAIVAPTTPTNYKLQENYHHQLSPQITNTDHHNHHHHFNNVIHSPRSSPQSSTGRHMGQNQQHQHYQSSSYQQSPLVSRDTRVLNRGDGIQATIIAHPSSAKVDAMMINQSFDHQPVVNIAGAPGINLDPSLAASLLRGTNIDAYESSTSSMLRSNGQMNTNSKAFLVATRLSKTMAQSGQGAKSLSSSSSSSSSASASTTSSQDHGEQQIKVSNNHHQRQQISLRECDNISPSNSHSLNTTSSLASSSSRSTNRTSSRMTPKQTKIKTMGLNDQQQEDGETSSSERSKSSRNKGSQLVKSNSSSLQQSRSRNPSLISRQRKQQRESSSEEKSVDDNEGIGCSFVDEPEERNWITSKLVQ